MDRGLLADAQWENNVIPLPPAVRDGAMPVPTGPVGRWQIVEAAAWPREHLDQCGPAFLRIDVDVDVDVDGNGGDEDTASRGADGPTGSTKGGSTASSPAIVATKPSSPPSRRSFPATSWMNIIS